MRHKISVINKVSDMLANGLSIPQIVRKTGISRATICIWKSKFKMQSGNPISVLREKFTHLVSQESLTEEQQILADKYLKWLDKSIKQAERIDRIFMRREKKPDDKVTRNKKMKVNDLRGIDWDNIKQPAWEEWQKKAFADKSRIRFLLVTRQGGKTFAMAWEALIELGKECINQNFLAASQEQTFISRDYIINFAEEFLNVKLTGYDKIKVRTDKGIRTFKFLPANPTTVQGFNGHIRFDEFCHIPRCKKLVVKAKPIATRNGYRITYYSSTSSKQTYGYEVWSGIDESGEKRSEKISRHFVTLEQAIEQGLKGVDVEDIKSMFSDEEYRQLYMLEWVDDAESFFKEAELERCKVSNKLTWEGGIVCIGYDPSRSRDNASLTISEYNTKTRMWRLLNRITMKDKAWEYQAEVVCNVVNQYNAKYLCVDVSGRGQGLWVQPAIQNLKIQKEGIEYNQKTKQELVLRGKRIIEEGRLEFDASDTLFTASLFAIKYQVGGNGGMIFRANRTNQIGHADAAFSWLHSVAYELFKFKPTPKLTVVFKKAA